MSVLAPFITAQKLRQMFTSQGTDTFQYIHLIRYYLATKKEWTADCYSTAVCVKWNENALVSMSGSWTKVRRNRLFNPRKVPLFYVLQETHVLDQCKIFFFFFCHSPTFLQGSGNSKCLGAGIIFVYLKLKPDMCCFPVSRGDWFHTFLSIKFCSVTGKSRPVRQATEPKGLEGCI